MPIKSYARDGHARAANDHIGKKRRSGNATKQKKLWFPICILYQTLFRLCFGGGVALQFGGRLVGDRGGIVARDQ